MTKLSVPVELTDVELDAVAAGQTSQGTIGNGLVVVGANLSDTVDVNNNNVDVSLLNNSLHNVGIGVAVAAGLLAPAGAGVFNRV